MTFTKDDVSPYRTVNGEQVPLSDEEREALADEWNANLAKPVARTKDIADQISELSVERKNALKVALGI